MLNVLPRVEMSRSCAAGMRYSAGESSNRCTFAPKRPIMLVGVPRRGQIHLLRIFDRVPSATVQTNSLFYLLIGTITLDFRTVSLAVHLIGGPS